MNPTFGVLLATLALAAASPTVAADPESWVCVPGDGGRWRCAQGNTELETSPLPALAEPAQGTSSQTPTDEAGGAMPSIFSRDRRRGRSAPIEPPGPDVGASPPLDIAARGAFALKIASVSSTEEIPAFVESFGLDPRLVRFVGIEEAGATRQLILWGGFPSVRGAQRAIAGLPGVVRSMRPQIVRADGFANPLRVLLDRDGGAVESADPIVEVAPAPAPASSVPEPIEEPAKPRPQSQTVAKDTGAARAPKPASPSTSTTVELSVPASRPRAMAKNAAGASKPAPRSTPTKVEPPEPTSRRQAMVEDTGAAADPQSSPASASTTVEPPESTPQPQPVVKNTGTAGAPRPVLTPATPSTESAESPPRPRPATASATRPERRAENLVPEPAGARLRSQPPATTVAALPGRGPEAFLVLAGTYTVQLTSLRDSALIARYLRRHQLDPSRVYRLQVDEGVGPRWLLLWGAYPSLERAEAARDALPATIRSPWVRRVDPLKAQVQSNR